MSEVEIVQTLTGAGLTGTGALVAWRVFGASLAALGTNLGKWTDRWTANFLRISERANEKLGDRADEPGDVSPRVLQRVITDGAWTDDPVALDYFAGLVAGSRSPDGGDDSNLPSVTLLAGLGARHIRAHYVIYLAIRRSLYGGWYMGTTEGRTAAQIFIPYEEFSRGMAIAPSLAPTVAPGIIATLARVGLIEPQPWGTGGSDVLAPLMNGSDPGTTGIFVSPSWLGLDLAIRADGPSEPNSVSRFLYLAGWHDPLGIDCDDSCAQFPFAPSNATALTELRDRVKWLGTEVTNVGWRIALALDMRT